MTGWCPHPGDDHGLGVPSAARDGAAAVGCCGRRAGPGQAVPICCLAGKQQLNICVIVIPQARPVVLCREAPGPLVFSLFFWWDAHKAFAADETQQVQEHWRTWHLGQPSADEHWEVGGSKAQTSHWQTICLSVVWTLPAHIYVFEGLFFIFPPCNFNSLLKPQV